MLGYITTTEQGASDRLIEAAARQFLAQGVKLSGAVQINKELRGNARSKMVLDILGTDQNIVISQNLGPHASGCRLDPEGLETAAHLIWSSLDQPRDLLILNKFGKQERDGQGFRDVLVKALDNDVPVLLGVNQTLEAAFQDFAGDFASKLGATLPEITHWFESFSKR
jgi:hypothetical protein